MKIIYSLILGLLISGCTKASNITYNSTTDKKATTQLYENEQCKYFAGPFEVQGKLNIDQLVEDTIKKANEDGLYGNEMVNIKVKKGGYVSPFVSKYCIHIEGNIVYRKK